MYYNRNKSHHAIKHRKTFTRVNRPDGLGAGNGEVALGVGVPALGHHQLDGPWLLHHLTEHPHRLVVGHVLKVYIVHLEWFNGVSDMGCLTDSSDYQGSPNSK